MAQEAVDSVSVVRACEAPPSTGCVEWLGNEDSPVDGSQCTEGSVTHAVTLMHRLRAVGDYVRQSVCHVHADELEGPDISRLFQKVAAVEQPQVPLLVDEDNYFLCLPSCLLFFVLLISL